MSVDTLQLLQVYATLSFQMFSYPDLGKLPPESTQWPWKQNFNAHSEAQARAKMLCMVIEEVTSRKTPHAAAGTTLPSSSG